MVRMARKLSYGLGMADWQERIDVRRLREERQERARAIMREQGVPSLLAAGPPNTRYLTGVRGAEFLPQLWYVLFFADHDPVVFAHAGYHVNLATEAPWITHWRFARSWLGGILPPDAITEERTKFAEEIAAEVRDRGLADEPIALVGFDGPSADALRDAGLQPQPGQALMLEARKLKTRDEIECMKVTEALADVAWYKVQEVLRPGMTETQLSQQAAQAAMEAGAEMVPPMNFRSGPTTYERGIHGTGRIIEHGDLAYGAFCGISFLGYKTCSYRTFLVGREPTTQERDWYRELVDRVDAIIDAIKPGATTADAARHFPPASKWGFTDEAEVLTVEIGHGIGLAQYDIPVINRQWSLDHPQVFEAGMVIAIESLEGNPEAGGVRLENVVVVTEDGAEIIDHFPREEITVV